MAALTLVIVWLGTHSLTGVGSGRKWLAISVRLALVLVLLLLLAGFEFKRTNHALSLMVLRDVSRSTQNVPVTANGDLQQQITEYLQSQVAHKPPGDLIGQISFDGAAQVDSVPAETFDLGAAASHQMVDGTNVAQAIQLGLASLSGQTMDRMLLLWDGNATTGNLDAAISAAAARHVPIDVVPLRYSIHHEIMVQRLNVPASRAQGDPVNLDVVIYSHNPGPVQATLRLTDRDQSTPAISRRIMLQPGANVEHLSAGKLPVGTHYFSASVEGAPGSDTIAENNSADGVTLVKGKGRLLCIDNSESPGIFEAALRGQGITLNEKPISDFPRDLLGLQEYQAVILINVPRGLGGLDNTQDQLLSRYVQDLGGGLLMIGGPNAFGAGGWIGSQVEKILPVSCQPPAHHIMPAGALVLVIDHSGSMAETIHNAKGTKEKFANEAAVLALKTLMARDYVGVIAFDTMPTWVVPLSQNQNPQRTSQQIEQIAPAGGTSIYPALVEAYESLKQLNDKDAAIKHIVLLTDGQSHPGDWAEITAKMRAAHITLSTVGVGDDADRRLLTDLARMGRGKFYFIQDPKVLPQVFVKEAMTLRATLIKEKPFIPRVQDGDSPMIAGFEAFPPLTGLVSTWPKSSPMVVEPLVSNEADPVLAYWRAGLGQAAVFTSDAGDRWAVPWARWGGYSRFWSQTLRTIERAGGTSMASARIIPTTPGHARLVVEAVGQKQQFANFLGVWAMLLSPDPHDSGQAIQLHQTGPGVYEADLKTPATGAYLAAVHINQGKSGNTWVNAAYVAPASAEMRDLESNEFALTELARRTGGRLLNPFDPKANLFDRAGLVEPTTAFPLTNDLLALAIFLLLLDVAVRRLSFDRRGLTRAAGYLLGYVRRPAGPGASATPISVNALKHARQAAAPEPALIKPPKDETPILIQSGAPAPTNPIPEPAEPANPMGRLAAAKRRAQKVFKE